MSDDDLVERFSGAIADVGWFVHDRVADVWRWSEGMYLIHGYDPDEVEPTGDLLLQHKHPDDRDLVLDARRRAYSSAAPVSCSHRILRRDGELRSVVTVARSEPDEDGQVRYLHGFMTDLTDSRVSDTRYATAEAVVSATGNRAVIEQAKGALMLTYGIDADAAFNVLRRHSQHRNMRLAAVAELFVASFSDSRWVTQLRPVLGDVLDRYLAEVAPGPGVAPASRVERVDAP